jgi:sterol desaturase/sphingolipid hydroxylase (fatty acid hydroxylase superfamily)
MFAVLNALLIYHPDIRPLTTLYPQVSDRGWLYYFVIFPLLFFVHDTYFYFIHRMMHLPFLYKHVHKVHHKSTNPSPWAAYAFHPFESLLEFGILPLFLFTIPLHSTHILLFFLAMIAYNVYGHLGFELFPRGFSYSKLGCWINTSVNHNQHHQYFTGNYSLYFLFWDRILGTLRKDYSQKYVEMCHQRDGWKDLPGKQPNSTPSDAHLPQSTNQS